MSADDKTILRFPDGRRRTGPIKVRVINRLLTGARDGRLACFQACEMVYTLLEGDTL